MDRQVVFYTTGGTVQAGGGVYIKRKADDDLLALCRKGEFAFILSSRQIGKSSLVVGTVEQLKKEDVQCVIVDLSAIGVNVTPDEWYLGILNEVSKTLSLKTDVFAWWEDRKQLGPTLRLVNFFGDVLLMQISSRIVLFFDEIDSTLSIPFSDDFYAALRYLYNSRSTNPEMKRLSIVLIGVATPSELIAESRRTPFNVGHRVELTDFTLDEAKPLSAGLGINGELVLEWVFEWTQGHPYLTQLMCASLAKSGESLTKDAVRNTVVLLFEGEQGSRDNNLQFVRDMLTKRAPNVQRVLATYRNIRIGRAVIDDERSVEKAHLKISGVVRRENRLLKLRNPIYEKTFDLAWIKENMPSQTTRAIVIATTLLTLVIVTLFAITGQLNRFIYRPLSMEWVTIPAGEFTMGSENPGEDPIHIVYLDAYQIGRYETTNDQYNVCVKAGICVTPRNDSYNNVAYKEYPVTDVDWFDAKTFCEWNDRNGRLPSEAEWEKAARGNSGSIYPWGDDPWNPELANCCQINAAGLQSVGQYPKGVSTYGVYDMAGSVWEWVGDWYSIDYYLTTTPNNPIGPSEPPTGTSARVIRGGSWQDTENTIRSTIRGNSDPTLFNAAIGFRCARSE